MTKDKLIELSKMYSIEEIAKIINRSVATVYRALHKYNIPLPTAKNSKKDRNTIIVYLYKEKGYKLTEIAKMFNVSRQRIHQILQKQERNCE